MCLILTGCGLIKSEPTPTPTLEIPTPTMEPMAALVNGEGITIVEYQAELDRYLSAANNTGESAPGGVEPKTMILDELVDEVLLSQSAYLSGFQLSDTDLETRINQLAKQLGSTQALLDWQSRNGYSEADLRRSLRRSVDATWMRDKIISAVPLEVEQILARQILLTDEQTALAVKAQLDSGVDFTNLAYQYDPVAGGDLGWFPRGVLNVPEVESAALATETGKYTDVVKSTIGWHIILVVERDFTKELSPDALLSLRHQALSQWLAERRSESTIDILI
ncbi:MAG: peptidylprolyl isomerase [Anaerolineaceae bacterium]